jgi:hypothetical protein
VEEQLGTGAEEPGIKGFTRSVIGKLSAAKLGATVLLFSVIVGLASVAVATEDVPPIGFVTVQSYDSAKGVFPQEGPVVSLVIMVASGVHKLVGLAVNEQTGGSTTQIVLW